MVAKPIRNSVTIAELLRDVLYMGAGSLNTQAWPAAPYKRRYQNRICVTEDMLITTQMYMYNNDAYHIG